MQQQSALDSSDVNIIADAYVTACTFIDGDADLGAMSLQERQNLLAKYLVRAAAHGERNRTKLANGGIGFLRKLAAHRSARTARAAVRRPYPDEARNVSL